MRTINNAQVYDFISQLRRNIQNFNLADDQEQQLHEIQQQYVLLSILNRVMDGKTYFVGIDHELFSKEQDNG